MQVPGQELCVKRKNKFTENWICSKHDSHKCQISAITRTDVLIETHR